jgi:hypothetical protein
MLHRKSKLNTNLFVNDQVITRRNENPPRAVLKLANVTVD